MFNKNHNPETKKISVVDKIEKQRVKYLYVPKKLHRCKSGTHDFNIENKATYVFVCNKCHFARKAYPTTYVFTPEHQLKHKISGEFV